MSALGLLTALEGGSAQSVQLEKQPGTRNLTPSVRVCRVRPAPVEGHPCQLPHGEHGDGHHEDVLPQDQRDPQGWQEAGLVKLRDHCAADPSQGVPEEDQGAGDHLLQ